MNNTTLDTALAAEEQRLRAEAEAAFDAAKRSPTIANRKAYKRATAALEDFQRQRLQVEAEPLFRNIPEMVAHLDNSGWKISDSTAYDHRDQGKLRLAEDGTISLAQAEGYARVYLKKKDGTPGAVAGRNLQEEKLLEEITRIRHDAKLKEIKLKAELGEWIPRAEVEIQLAKRAAYLRSDLKNVFRAGAMEIIRQVGGDPQKAPQLIAYGVGLVDETIDRYSRPIAGFEEE